MLFEDGYNIPKRKFFQNILYINLYGVLGTMLNFVAIFAILYFFNTYSIFIAMLRSHYIGLGEYSDSPEQLSDPHVFCCHVQH